MLSRRFLLARSDPGLTQKQTGLSADGDASEMVADATPGDRATPGKVNTAKGWAQGLLLWAMDVMQDVRVAYYHLSFA